MRRYVEEHNAEKGELHKEDGIDCPECKNRGLIASLADDGALMITKCRCMEARNSFQRMKRSGLENLVGRYSMANFTVNTPWHQVMMDKAKKFLESDGTAWLYVGGQVGCGKSHICTAVCDEVLKRGKSVHYMLWRDESAKLKALVNDAEAYEQEIGRLKSVDVLYIDDFFKTQDSGGGGFRPGGNMPTAGDLNLAFEILNFRYCNKKKQTIISCEYMIDELLDISESIASRIYERARETCVEISRDKKKNYRLR